jgi:hypothetical protein
VSYRGSGTHKSSTDIDRNDQGGAFYHTFDSDRPIAEWFRTKTDRSVDILLKLEHNNSKEKVNSAN